MKRIKGLFLKMVLMFSMFTMFITNTYARTLSIDEVNEKFEANFKDLSDINSLINTSTKELTLSYKDELLMTLNYTDEYIEFTNSDESDIDAGLAIMIYCGFMINSVLEAAGFPIDTLNNTNVTEETLTDKYDEYGLEVKSKYVETDTTKGDLITYFKISLDTDKLTRLYKLLSTDEPKEESDEYQASISIFNVSNVASIKVTVSKNDNNLEDAKCYIYRSDKEDGNFQKLIDTPVNCQEGYTDQDLKPNTLYYYKASVEGLPLETETMSLKTFDRNLTDIANDKDKYKSENTLDDKKEEKSTNTVPNPKTGVLLDAITFVVVSFISFILYIILRKRSILKNL